MANIQQRGGGWQVRWKEAVVTVQTDGSTSKVWRERSRTFDSKYDAETFEAERTLGNKRGERFDPETERAAVTIAAVLDAWAASPSNAQTKRWRTSTVARARAAYGDRPVLDLSARLLRDYADRLRADGLLSVDRYVGALEQAWAYAWDNRNRDRFPGVTEPVRIVGDDADAPVQRRAPVVRTAVATMADVDRMRAEIGDGWKHGDSSARAALVCRYCGLRIAQVVNLRWRDVRLDGGAAGPYIVIHAHTRGAKKGRTRVLPLHPALAAEMAGWGVREGRVFPSTNNYWITGEAAREAMTTAWESSGVDRAVWDIPDDEEGKRSHGSPTHGIRAAVFTTLLREGTAYDVACYAVGQATTATRAAYVPENAPEASPWWVPLVAAVAKIPDHRETDNVVTLAARGR